MQSFNNAWKLFSDWLSPKNPVNELSIPTNEDGLEEGMLNQKEHGQVLIPHTSNCEWGDDRRNLMLFWVTRISEVVRGGLTISFFVFTFIFGSQKSADIGKANVRDFVNYLNFAFLEASALNFLSIVGVVALLMRTGGAETRTSILLNDLKPGVDTNAEWMVVEKRSAKIALAYFITSIGSLLSIVAVLINVNIEYEVRGPVYSVVSDNYASSAVAVLSGTFLTLILEAILRIALARRDLERGKLGLSPLVGMEFRSICGREKDSSSQEHLQNADQQQSYSRLLEVTPQNSEPSSQDANQRQSSRLTCGLC